MKKTILRELMQRHGLLPGGDVGGEAGGEAGGSAVSTAAEGSSEGGGGGGGGAAASPSDAVNAAEISISSEEILARCSCSGSHSKPSP